MNSCGFTVNIPPIYCYVRAEYLYNMESHKAKYLPCMVFGADSVYGRAVGVDILLNNGASFARLPISAIVHNTNAPDLPLDWLCLWNNFSYCFEVIEYTALRGAECEVILKDKKWYRGEYMFTFSWLGNSFSENPGEGGFKRAVMIKLDNGCFTLQPYNRIKWHDQAFVTKPFPEHPDYKTNEQVWSVENSVTEDSDKYFYDVKSCQDHDHMSSKEKCWGFSITNNIGWPDHYCCYTCGKCDFNECTNYMNKKKESISLAGKGYFCALCKEYHPELAVCPIKI